MANTTIHTITPANIAFLHVLKKGLKNQLGYKLISWYLTSMIASLLIIAFWGYIEHKMKAQGPHLIYFYYTQEFFARSTIFWLSCIGYNVYVQYKEANVPKTDRMRKDRMRFIWFSVYVWGGTLTLCIARKIIEKFLIVSVVLTYLIVFFNIFAFLVLAVKICLIRCRVIGISTEKHIKCKLARTIFRLGILMGIPGLLLAILSPVIGTTPIYVMTHLEPYVVFGTFIWEYENCKSLFRCKCCCPASRNEENDIAMEGITVTL